MRLSGSKGYLVEGSVLKLGCPDKTGSTIFPTASAYPIGARQASMSCPVPAPWLVFSGSSYDVVQQKGYE